MSVRCPFAVWRPITANVTRGGRKTLRGFVPHVQTNDGDLFGFFNTPKPPGHGGSADFQCFKDGRLQQFVDLVDQSWAQGSTTHNGNPTFMSCEFEGAVDEPMTPEQIDMGGRLMAWSITDVNDWPLQLNLDPDHGEGVTPHHVFGGGHTCPGPGPREGQFPDLIAAAHRWLSPSAPPTLGDLPMVIIVKPDNGPQFLVDTTSGLVAGLADPASRDNLVTDSKVPVVSLSDQTWKNIATACTKVRTKQE